MRENNPIQFPQPRHSEKMMVDGIPVKINFACEQPDGVMQNIERILLQSPRFGVKKAHNQ